MSQETDTFGIIMSSVEHTNASHFNCLPFSKATKRGEWHKYALYKRSKKAIQISPICSSNYHPTPSLLRTIQISIATLKRFADTPTERWLQVGKRISFTPNNIRT